MWMLSTYRKIYLGNQNTEMKSHVKIQYINSPVIPFPVIYLFLKKPLSGNSWLAGFCNEAH